MSVVNYRKLLFCEKVTVSKNNQERWFGSYKLIKKMIGTASKLLIENE